MLLNVTAPGLRQQQRSLDDTLDRIRSRFNPRDSIVLTVTDQDPYRFMMYYLPDYLVLRLDSAAGSVLTARGQRQGNWTQPADCLFEDAGVHNVVWVLAARGEPGLEPAGATLVSPPDAAPFRTWATALGADTPVYLGFQLRTCRDSIVAFAG
jgi:hypothetical protein